MDIMTHSLHRRGLVLLLVASLVALPTFGHAQGRPVTHFRDAASIPAWWSQWPRVLGLPAAAMQDSVVALARAQLGRRYVFGGAQPERGFDCSGLVQYVMRVLGVDVPRTAAQQARIGARVARDTTQLRPGDLLVFGSDTVIEHVGIYVGEGRFVHASSVAGRVIESPLRRPPDPLIKPWVAVRRLMPVHP